MFYCKACSKERNYEYYDINKKKPNLEIAVLMLGGKAITFAQIVAFFRIRKVGLAIRCKYCNEISVRCPYCDNANIFRNIQVQKCDNCQTKYYNYI